MMSMDALPPSLLDLTAYLLSKLGKQARSSTGDRLAARGLRLWHFAVLAALADFGPHIQRDLAARLGIDASDVVKVVDDLADAGYAERARDLVDRRRITVTLTPAGHSALAELQAEAKAADEVLLAPLNAAERVQLHALLMWVFASSSDGGIGPV